MAWNDDSAAGNTMARVGWGRAGLVAGAILLAKRRRQEKEKRQQQKLLEADMEKELAKAGLPPLKELWGDLNDWELDPNDIR
jgi:hypothetical protein